jgi:hypothetical protein
MFVLQKLLDAPFYFLPFAALNVGYGVLLFFKGIVQAS